MPFGYTHKVFPHPAVEYIPLLPVFTGQVERPLQSTGPQIFVLKGNENYDHFPLSDELRHMQIQFDSELGILLLNAEYELIKYRGHYVTLVIHPAPGKHQSLKIVSRYFYKSDLVFQGVDPGGKVLTYKLVNLPIKR